MPYNTSTDGTLSRCLSPKLDDAASSMLRLVQEHMVAILRPINEHINDLYKKNGELSRSVGTTDNSIDKLRERLDHHDLGLAALDSKDGLIEAEMKAFMNDLTEANLVRKVAAVEAEVRAEKKARNEIDDRVDLVSAALQALQSSIDESSSYVHRVELKVWQTANLAERVERGVTGFQEELDKIKERYFDLSRGIEQVHHAQEDVRKCFDKLTIDVEVVQNEVSTAVTSLEARARGLEVAAVSSSQIVERHEEQLASLGESTSRALKELANIREELHHLEEENDKQDEEANTIKQEHEAKMAEEAKKQVSVLERLKEAEIGLSKVRTTLAKELEKNIPNVVRDLTITVDRHGNTMTQHATAIRAVEASQSVHGDQLLTLELRTSESRLAEAELAKRTGNAEDSIREQRMQHDKSVHRIDNHHVELEKMEVYTSTTRHALGQTNAAVQSLHGDLGTTKGGLANTAMRLDLAHEYITGIGQGFQEAHKLTLTGQDGMLAPKCGLDRTRPLPMIGRPSSAPRNKTTPRVGSSSKEVPAGSQATA